MKRFVSKILVVLFLAALINAQDENRKLELIDEFGKLPLGDLSARMDLLAFTVREKKDVSALIRIYGGTETLLAAPFIRKAIFGAYFSKANRNIGESKLTIQLCNLNEPEIRTEFLLVPKEIKVDTCEENFSVPRKTKLIYSEWLLPVNDADDYLGTTGVDQAVSEARYDLIARVLKESPESKIYVIDYAGRYFDDFNNGNKITKVDSLNVNNKDLKKIRSAVIKKGVHSSRIMMLKGGFMDGHREIEVYLVPKNSEVPKPKPDYFPNKKRQEKK